MLRFPLTLILPKFAPLKTQVSKPKAAVVHANVLLMLRLSEIHAKENQVSITKAAVVHANVLLTPRTCKNTLSKWFVETSCCSSVLKILLTFNIKKESVFSLK